MQQISHKITTIIKDLYGLEVKVELDRPDAQFGDYASNVALRLAKPLGKNPREIGEEVALKLKKSNDFSEVTVAGPGFINIRLSDRMLLESLSAEVTKSREKITTVIETNNPNPFKAMHIGHAFNAILADTIANLLEASGARIYRVSYHGDVGAHVGKSMYSLLKFVNGEPERLSEIPTSERNTFMSKMYADGARAYKDSPEAKKEIDMLASKSFTREDPVYAAVYEMCKKWSFDEIDAIVVRLGNQPIERRFLESDADYRGVEIVKKNTPGVFEESDGAYIFRGSEHGAFDNVFVAASGRGLYAARDLGLMQLKNEYYHPQKSYIVTAEEQKDYFKGVIAAAELVNPDIKGVTVNIPHGTVKLTTGKMSSRNGEVLEIAWLFDLVREAIIKRGGEPTDEIIAGALRYQFLKVRVGSDVVFNVNEAVSLQGNTGSYLQYAYARGKRIIEKSKVGVSDLKDVALNESERLLVRKMSEFNEVLELTNYELMPHHLCTYLYELAQEFNRFYEKNKVIGSEEESQRIALTTQYLGFMKRGLEVLGIHAPENM